MPRTALCSEAAESTARSTERRGRSFYPNAERSAAALRGEARLTRGYRLPARHVVHTVGPIWRGGEAGEESVLANCYANSLLLAQEHGLRTIAFPAISTGIYGYPVEAAAAVASRTVASFLKEAPRSLDELLFVCFRRHAAMRRRSPLTGRLMSHDERCGFAGPND